MPDAKKPWKRKPGAGRNPKYNPELGEKIVTWVRNGAHLKTAAAWAGIDDQTLSRWKREGVADPKSKYAEFARKVQEAESGAELKLGLVFFQAAAKDPEYAEKYLRIRWRKRWSEKKALEINGGKRPVKVEVRQDLSKLSDAELAALEQLLEKAAVSESEED